MWPYTWLPCCHSVEKRLFEYFGMGGYNDAEQALTNGPVQLRVLFWGSALGNTVFKDVVNSDLLYATGSIIFVLIALCLHTKSFFLGGFGMLQILLSM